FSSRRRHTRSKRDWSSDVCSSDLVLQALRRGGKRISRCALRRDPRAALFFLQIHTNAFSHDGDKRMRSQAPRADSETMALDDFRSEERRVGKECRDERATEE